MRTSALTFSLRRHVHTSMHDMHRRCAGAGHWSGLSWCCSDVHRCSRSAIGFNASSPMWQRSAEVKGAVYPAGCSRSSASRGARRRASRAAARPLPPPTAPPCSCTPPTPASRWASSGGHRSSDAGSTMTMHIVLVICCGPCTEVHMSKVCLRSQHAGSAASPAWRICNPMCRAHAAKVRSIWWSPDDTTLLTCGADGSVFQWRVAGLARLKEFALQARARAQVICTPLLSAQICRSRLTSMYVRHHVSCHLRCCWHAVRPSSSRC